MSREPDAIDISVLSKVSSDYIKSVVGEPVPVNYEIYEVDGVKHSNYLLGITGYLTY